MRRIYGRGHWNGAFDMRNLTYTVHVEVVCGDDFWVSEDMGCCLRVRIPQSTTPILQPLKIAMVDSRNSSCLYRKKHLWAFKRTH